ncbi:PRP18 domain-containing protein [Cryptosporidium ubiquitum]|uniref:Pre-mRNA-splicing factor 18 n=1 Tax=Cryptosporidium ubiquitum TaxID=857276 RepID=A0A1J4MQC3_9CRYT|nr:PRP18 domain-containing protein [Cryptosporidium ubiquitum]OII75204.1 PRP18 domain-containing protein [Cryptosporidium ubiquitum]
MDSLKELINSKKTELRKKLGKYYDRYSYSTGSLMTFLFQIYLDNRKWVSQSELQDYERQEYIKRQKEKDLKKVKKENIKAPHYSISESISRESIDDQRKDVNFSVEDVQKSNPKHLEDRSENVFLGISIQNKETIRRLRLLGEPITLFGEGDIERYNRLRRLEFQGRTNEEMNIGQQNIFLHGFDPNISLYSVSEDHRKVEIYEEFEHIDGESNQKFILRWIDTQLKEWEKLLKSRKKVESETEKGRQDSAQYYQTKRDIQPLINSLETSDGKVDQEVLDKLFEIVTLCNQRDYNKAQDKYIELAIGNAPWPMGVTMVGIHERAGRTKIFSSHIAHVLNDETTRKYIQMFKRLVTHCESKRPSRELQKKSI